MAQTSKLNRISVGLSDAELAELQTLSETHRVSMAWLGRQAITEFLQRYAQEQRQLPLALRSEARGARA